MSAGAPGSSNAGSDSAAQALFVHAMVAARARVLADPGVDVLRPMVAEAQQFAGTAQSSASVLATTVTPADARGAGALYAGALAAAKLRDFALAQSLVARLKSLAGSKPGNSGSPGASQVIELLSLEVDLLAGHQQLLDR